MAVSKVYSVYVNTMIFTIVSGVLSLILLLALVYVPSVAEYSVLILTIQVGLLAIILQALVRLWWAQRSKDIDMATSNRNTLAVTFCPDYMVASGDASGVTCTNSYPVTDSSTPIAIWTGTPDHPNTAPTMVTLANMTGKPIADVCMAADNPNPDPNSALLTTSTAYVPWTELRSRCKTFSYS